MTRSILPAALAAALLPGLASGQAVQFEARTTTTATALAEVFFFGQWWRDSRSTPANTPMVGRSIGAYVNLLECSAAAGASVNALAQGIRCRADSSVWGLCPANAAASMSLRVVVRAATITRGRLLITAERRLLQSLLIDVGEDLDYELTSGFGTAPTGTVEVALDVGPGGVPILVAYSVDDNGDLGIDLEFFADAGGEMSLEESSCGPRLQGSLTRDGNDATLRLMAAELPASATSFLVLGTRLIRVPVPPTHCPLLTDLAVVVPLTRSLAGTNSQRVALPPGLSGRVYAQVLSGERAGTEDRWTTSERLRIDLR